MSNNITIELCAEDRKRIDELIGFAGLLVGEQKQYLAFMENLVNIPRMTQAEDGTVKLVTDEAHEAPEQPEPVNEHPVDEVSPHAAPEPVAEPEPPKYTKDDVLALVQKLAQPNSPKREDAKAIVKSYGAKVSDIPEDKYAEVMDKLTALEG